MQFSYIDRSRWIDKCCRREGSRGEGGRASFHPIFLFFILKEISNHFSFSLPVSFRRNELKGKTIKGKEDKSRKNVEQ